MSKTGTYGAYQTTLRRWKVYEIETPNGQVTRHLCGHDVLQDVGRATSAIASFDKASMLVVTQSGNRYRLQGLPGDSKLADKAWRKWCTDNQVVGERDVTREYLDVSKVSTVGFHKLIRSAVARETED
ncbi:MAG: hypothetical protein Fur0040_03350 [Sideroxydans sp.]